MDALANSILGGLTASVPFKSLEKFDKGWQARSADLVEDHFQKHMQKKMSLKFVAKHGNKHSKAELLEFASKEGADITKGAANKLIELGSKTAYKGIIDKMTGSEKSPDALNKLALKALEKDSGFMTAFEAKVIEEGEKRLEKKMTKAK